MKMNMFSKLMASLILTVLIVFALTAPQAQAQMTTGSLTLGTNNLAATTTNSTAGTALRLRSGAKEGIGVSFLMEGTGLATDGVTNAVTANFDLSQDGTNYTMHRPITMTITANSTNKVTGWTNLSPSLIGNARYIKPTRLINDNPTNVTLVIRYGYFN